MVSLRFNHFTNFLDFCLTQNMAMIQPLFPSKRWKIFWPKNDGEKWSRKNIFEIPTCGRFFFIIHFTS